MKRTFLFVDWFNVDKGRMEATLDPERLSEEGKAVIERNKREWGIYPDLSGHGMKRSRIPYGIRITPEKAQKSEPWLTADRRWEKSAGGYHAVIHEQGKYRCWHQVTLTKKAAKSVFPPEIPQERRQYALAYAESTDGLHWQKPALGLFKFEGQDTNIVSPYGAQETGVFRDDSAPAEERYKCFDWDRLPEVPADKGAFHWYGLYGCVSPDGYRWTRLSDPLLPYFHDTENIGYWDPLLRKYVGYFRGHLGGRAISRSETEDFRHWPPAEVILCPGPEDGPTEDYYTNCFTCYPGDPSLRFLFPAIYHHDSDQLDIRMAVSRDNPSFNWVSHQPIIELGEPGAWDCGAIYAGPNLVHLPDGRLALPYSGNIYTHNEGFGRFYGDYTRESSSMAWAMWEDGRLAGIEAPNLGEFWTTPFTLEGTQIEINARTSRIGKVEVELWEAVASSVARPLEGYTLAECVPFNGDELWARCQWCGKQDVGELEGRKLRLHVRLSSAKVFGYRFV